MQKLSLFLVAFAFVVGTTGCIKQKIGCAIEKRAVDTITPALTEGLQCKKPENVRRDVTAVIKKAGLCKTGIIADLVCPPLTSWAASKLSEQIPADWECSAVDAKAKVQGILERACKLIPVENEEE